MEKFKIKSVTYINGKNDRTDVKVTTGRTTAIQALHYSTQLRRVYLPDPRYSFESLDWSKVLPLVMM